MALNRGDVVDVDVPGVGRRPGIVCTRQTAIAFLANVTVALVTRTIRGVPTEVRLERAQGLTDESVGNCDNLYTIPKSAVVGTRGALDPGQIRALDDALRLALALD